MGLHELTRYQLVADGQLRSVLSPLIATNNKSKASGNNKKSNKNKQSKSKKTKNNNSQLKITVQTAPVSAQPKMSVGNAYSSKTTKNGTTHFRSQTCIPISNASSTVGDTATADIAIGNATFFPQASALAAIHDKVKFHKVKLSWVPSLPTTSGGSVVMYFDADRTDTPPTDMQDAMQNKGARSGPLWSKLTYVCDRKMLRSNEMFSTTSDVASTSATNNTFTSPGRLHMHWTSQPGITYTTATVIGFAVIEYEVEFMFQSAQEATDVTPTRRKVDMPRDVSFVRTNRLVVDTYRNFVAGCAKRMDFYTFLTLFDEDGNLNLRKALEYEPDEISLSLAPSTSRSPSNGTFKIQRPEVGALNPLTISGFSRCPSFTPDWNSETGSIYYD